MQSTNSPNLNQIKLKDQLLFVADVCSSDLDGLDDLIVGSFEADPSGKSKAGKSYVIFGKINNAEVNLSVVASGTGGVGVCH
jgi:hypothetical protein